MRRTRLRFLLGLIFMSIGGALGLFYMPTVRKFTSMDIVLFFVLSSLFLGVYLLSGVIKLDKLFSIKGSRLIRRRLKEPRGSKKHIAEEMHAHSAKQDIYHTMLQKMLAGLDPSMDVSQTAEVRQAIEELRQRVGRRLPDRPPGHIGYPERGITVVGDGEADGVPRAVGRGVGLDSQITP